jgi:hypothetical protein
MIHGFVSQKNAIETIFLHTFWTWMRFGISARLDPKFQSEFLASKNKILFVILYHFKFGRTLLGCDTIEVLPWKAYRTIDRIP